MCLFIDELVSTIRYKCVQQRFKSVCLSAVIYVGSLATHRAPIKNSDKDCIQAESLMDTHANWYLLEILHYRFIKDGCPHIMFTSDIKLFLYILTILPPFWTAVSALVYVSTFALW